MHVQMRAHFLYIYFLLPFVYIVFEASAYAISFGKIWRTRNGEKRTSQSEKNKNNNNNETANLK